MDKNKKIHKEETALKKEVVFCAECGEELELFGISESKIDLKQLKKRYQRCKETGKFKGNKCAMLFIADPNEPSVLGDEDD